MIVAIVVSCLALVLMGAAIVLVRIVAETEALSSDLTEFRRRLLPAQARVQHASSEARARRSQLGR